MVSTVTGLQLLDSATSQGEGDMNEDLAGGTRNYAWMFDGATDMPPTFRPDPDVTGARWIAQFGDSWLRDSARGETPSELLSGLAAAVAAELRSQGMAAGGLPPTSSLGVVRADDARIMAAVVGDVSVYNVAKDDLLLESRFGEAERTAVAQRRASGDEAASVAAIVARRRSYLSGIGGQWVLGDNPAAGGAARRRVWTADPGDEILLATDGFARAVTDYGLVPSWKVLAEEIRSHGVCEMIGRIREVESDTERMRFFKRSDDACAALWRCA